MTVWDEVCRCGGQAVAFGRLATSVGTLGVAEPLCRRHAAEAARLTERAAAGRAQVDRAVRKYRGRLAA